MTVVWQGDVTRRIKVSQPRGVHARAVLAGGWLAERGQRSLGFWFRASDLVGVRQRWLERSSV